MSWLSNSKDDVTHNVKYKNGDIEYGLNEEEAKQRIKDDGGDPEPQGKYGNQVCWRSS